MSSLAFALMGCKKQAPEEQSSETAVPTSVEEIERIATDAGYTCKRKEEVGIKEINDDLEVAKVCGEVINCLTVSSSADHTGVIVFEFDSEESATEFYGHAEEMLGKLKDGMSKERRGKLFIYGNTSVIDRIW